MSRIDPNAARSAGGTSILHFWGHYLAAALLIGGGWALRPALLANWAIAIGVLLLAWAAVVVVFGTRWWVTEEQVLQSEGVISRRTREIPMRTVRGVEVRQTFVGRLLDVGSVHVAAGEADGDAVVLSGVKAPNELARKIRTSDD